MRRVFTQKQFYKVSKTKIEKKYWHELRGYPENLNEMDFTDYGLKPWQSLKNKYKNLQLDQSITGDNVSELFKPLKGKDEMGFSDYLGRKMILTQKNFKQHTTGKYLNENEQRHRLFPHVKDVLKSPDEVWLFKKSKKQKQVNYVKLYGKGAVIVNTSLNEEMEAVEINTWYKMIEKEEKNIRKGLLIKKEKDL